MERPHCLGAVCRKEMCAMPMSQPAPGGMAGIPKIKGKKGAAGRLRPYPGRRCFN